MSPNVHENSVEYKSRLEWAQWMASKGITVFIVEPGSKRPLGGYSWYARNTVDPQQVG